ncbi:hypothetical protein JD844_028239 [Phrynosoma platyrhinos]|uniref:Uncharacterized protein n=1 Tax=Phrynosoma platyrhinos TaxID=52577 RepID=A0ABQ7SHJ3_PHRPL|nr:hypothetical protein JD844_028239 [Phrynosoma platyrhinos]
MFPFDFPRLLEANYHLTEESGKILLERGATKVPGGKKSLQFGLQQRHSTPPEHQVNFVKKIQADVLMIIAQGGIFTKQSIDEIVEYSVIIQEAFRTSRKEDYHKGPEILGNQKPSCHSITGDDPSNLEWEKILIHHRIVIDNLLNVEGKQHQALKVRSPEEALQRLLEANNHLTEESGKILLERGATKVPGGLVYNRDIRLLSHTSHPIPIEHQVNYVKKIQADVLMITAQDGIFTKQSSDRFAEYFVILQEAFRASRKEVKGIVKKSSSDNPATAEMVNEIMMPSNKIERSSIGNGMPLVDLGETCPGGNGSGAEASEVEEIWPYEYEQRSGKVTLHTVVVYQDLPASGTDMILYCTRGQDELSTHDPPHFMFGIIGFSTEDSMIPMSGRLLWHKNRDVLSNLPFRLRVRDKMGALKVGKDLDRCSSSWRTSQYRR